MRVLVFAPIVRDGIEWPGYLLASDGRVQTKRRRGTRALSAEWRDLSSSVDAKGYAGLTICGPQGQRWKVRVHRLIATAFIPNPTSLPCVRHLDGDPCNNAVENLAWGTYTDNESDKHSHGTYWTRVGGRKLTTEQIHSIRDRVSAGETHASVARAMGCSRPTVSRIASGKIWRSE